MIVMVRIKDIYKGDRPRERLMRFGPDKLKDYELLALILNTGIKNENVVDISKKILRKYKINNLKQIKPKDLLEIKGVGKIKALRIIACLEFGKRVLNTKTFSFIYSPKDIWEDLKVIRGSKKEHFYVFYLDSRNQIINKELVSIGTLNASIVHPREVFEPAVRNLAAQIILSHNHPSQDPNPSEEDIVLTKRLIEAGRLLGIEIIDHVIISKEKYFSMKKQGLI